MSSKEKAEKIKKDYAKDPMSSNGAGGGVGGPQASGKGQDYSPNAIPDMRGIDVADNMGGLPGMNGMGEMPAVGGGVPSANLAIGLVNGVVIGPQSGKINNRFISGYMKTGAFLSNGKTYTSMRRGPKMIGQTGVNTTQISHGKKVAIAQQGNSSSTLVTNSRAQLNSSDSNIDVNAGKKGVRIKASRGVINSHTIRKVSRAPQNINAHQISGVKKAASLNAQNFVAQGSKVKIRQLINATEPGSKVQHHYGLVSGKKASKLAAAKESKRLSSSRKTPKLDSAETTTETLREINTVTKPIVMVVRPDEVQKMTGYSMENINSQLGQSQMLQSLGAIQNVGGSRSVQSESVGERITRDEVIEEHTEAIKKVMESSYGSKLSLSEAIAVANEALPIKQEKARERQEIAANNAKMAKTRADFTSNREKKTALDNSLKETAGAPNRLSELADRTIDKENMHQFSEKEIKEKREKAEEYLKEQIIADPDGDLAKEILGEEGHKKFKEEYAKIEGRREELEKQYRAEEEQKAIDKLQQGNEAYKDLTAEEIKALRESKEWDESIKEALERLHPELLTDDYISQDNLDMSEFEEASIGISGDIDVSVYNNVNLANAQNSGTYTTEENKKDKDERRKQSNDRYNEYARRQNEIRNGNLNAGGSNTSGVSTGGGSNQVQNPEPIISSKIRDMSEHQREKAAEEAKKELESRKKEA